MALQDLTPQLRTRLSRMEKAVGWFVVLATALLVFGFCYYIYNAAESKGWFKTKARFFTFVQTAEGLKVGDPVRLMGSDAGRITEISPMPPMNFQYNVYVEFELQEPNIGYMWTEGSRAKIAPAGFLSQRVIEVTKGTGGHSIYINYPVRDTSIIEARDLVGETDAQGSLRWRLAEDIHYPGTTQLLARAFQSLTNLDAIAAVGRTDVRILDRSQKRRGVTGVWNEQRNRYDVYASTNKPFWLRADESPALTERLESLVNQVQAALPNFLNLTNQLATVLSNSVSLTSNLDLVASDARPAVSNLALVTRQLNQPGALGDWLLPTNVNRQLESVLGGANTVMGTANTNLLNLNTSLFNLADLTSNLNHQVQVNTNILSQLSKAIVDTDNLVQGLKRHWLLRSAFKTKSTNAPPEKPRSTIQSPKGSGER